jgi:predicted small lipoprotein YifL
MRRIALVLLTACLLGACGQKGNLYLPDGEDTVGTGATPAAASPAPASPPAAGATSPTPEERERENAARSNRTN